MKKQIKKSGLTRLVLPFQRQLLSLLFLIGFGLFSTLNAQTVSGTLSDESGEPLIGVNVLVKGTDVGTITDIDGNYSINAGPSDVLVFSLSLIHI